MGGGLKEGKGWRGHGGGKKGFNVDP